MRGILVFCGDFEGDNDEPVSILAAGVDTFIPEESVPEGLRVNLHLVLFLSANSEDDIPAHTVTVNFFTDMNVPLDSRFRETVQFEELNDLKVLTGKGEMVFPDSGRYRVDVVLDDEEILDRRFITITTEHEYVAHP